MGKGSNYERVLVNEIAARNWVALRAGASGAGTDQPRPDIFATRAFNPSRAVDRPYPMARAIAIELKAPADGYTTLTEKEVEELREFATIAGATPVIMIRADFRRKNTPDTWSAFTLDELNETPSGFSVLQSMHPGATLDDIFGPRGDGD